MTSLYILLLHTVISKGYSSWNNALVRSWKIWLYWIVFSFQLTFYLILTRDLKIIFQREESTSTAGQKLAADILLTHALARIITLLATSGMGWWLNHPNNMLRHICMCFTDSCVCTSTIFVVRVIYSFGRDGFHLQTLVCMIYCNYVM